MHSRWRIAGLLFGSGFCALIYQTVWLRELRLIFGSSTGATAAVLAIFMGGLGAGGLVLSRRAEASDNPLKLYGNLELAIALLAAVSPLLLALARTLYLSLGGSLTLGIFGGTLLRMILTTLILGVTTFLMGGTLPAAARAAERLEDLGRRDTALLYGLNTLGAVAGTALSTFYLLEFAGNRKTLWIAAVVNVLIALLARAFSSKLESRVVSEPSDAGTEITFDSPLPSQFVLIASGVVGFAFLLMELVWYRMLAPLLGGTTFTFGLILAIALLGIGLGGAAYAMLWADRRATASAFALTCALEAVFIALPFALGDSVAIATLFMRDFGAFGFGGHVTAWTIITAFVVLPPSIVAGFQFPLLIALLGSGRQQVARHIGIAYASNTAGSIIGSLAGGFGLIPFLSAPGVWRLVTFLLCGLSVATVLARFATTRPLSRMSPIVVSLIAVLLITTIGPTAAWRHSAIGVGRASIPSITINGVRDWIHQQRRRIEWEKDGIESSVAMNSGDGYSFILNGKADGHVRRDAGTQVMSGMIGAIVHPGAASAFVIGLGTGSTAGWLAAVPSMKRVDVAELEPAILRVAEESAPVNLNVLRNPKVHLTTGDARELLLASSRNYDIIFSEPSNPYRAGIASLYTADFYRAVRQRLNRGGIFLQWVQCYDIDAQTVQSVYATLGSVFPVVETWQTQAADLVLLARNEPVTYDAEMLRQRISQPVFGDALRNTWRTATLEGFLAHYVASDAMTDKLAGRGDVNTDDVNQIEFGFARGVGGSGSFNALEIRAFAAATRTDLPTIKGLVDWEAIRRERLTQIAYEGILPAFLMRSTREEDMTRAIALLKSGDVDEASVLWRRGNTPPRDLIEISTDAQIRAENGEVSPELGLLRTWQPGEADAIEARAAWKRGDLPAATTLLTRSLARYQVDPWPAPEVMKRALRLTSEIARSDSTGRTAIHFHQLLRRPFAVHMLDELRNEALLNLASIIERGCGPLTTEALRNLEPDVPWDRGVLTTRAECYRGADQEIARRDLEEFLRHTPKPFGK